jgi:diguanylate cyclase (GGDEF)-like protein
MSSIATEAHLTTRPSEPPHAANPKGRFFRFLVASLVLTALLLPAAIGLARVQSSSRKDLDSRLRSRGILGAGFASTFIADLVDREKSQAPLRLGADPSRSAFQTLVGSFGFQAAVLLDDKGRVLKIAPSKPSLIGSKIGQNYAHLAAALHGDVGISNVVPSAATGVPVLAFAIPYRSEAGRRVFSGAFEVAQTPLNPYLDNTVSIKPHAVYLIDDTGAIAASSPASAQGNRHLQTENPQLFAAMRRESSGHYTDLAGPSYFTSRPVPGTPLKFVASVQTAELYASVGGAGRVLPWIILFLLAVFAAFAAWLLLRSASGRRELARLNGELELIARLDPVTGIYNRRHLQERLQLDLRLAGRRKQPVAILMIDVDHFKKVNDDYGHEVGDCVLKTVAHRIAGSMRLEDTVGRWGGEEFLAILPFTSLDGAAIAAERVRVSIESPGFMTSTGIEVAVTVSVGYTSATGLESQPLIGQADGALYAAKQAGRNRTMAPTDGRQPATVAG